MITPRHDPPVAHRLLQELIDRLSVATGLYPEPQLARGIVLYDEETGEEVARGPNGPVTIFLPQKTA